jgi:hypothetical protein
MLVCVDVSPSNTKKISMNFRIEMVRMLNFDPHWSTPALHEFKPKFAKSLKLQRNKKETKMYAQ